MNYEEKNRGIVLRTMKYGESGVIVYMYTENNGRMSYFMRSSKSGAVSIGRSRVPLEVFTPLDFIVSERRSGGGISIKEASRSFLTANTLFDIRKSTIVLFLSEFMYRVVKETSSNPLMFDFIYQSIKILDLMKGGEANFHVYFVVKLTKYMGFYPSEQYEQDAFFDITVARFTIIRPLHENYFSQQSARNLSRFLNCNAEGISEVKMDRNQRHELLCDMVRYYDYHHGVKHKIESLKILSEIF